MKRVLTIGVILFVAVATYYYHLSRARVENQKLLEIVLSSYSLAISVPAGSTLVYQEQEVSRICKTAEITKLFSTDHAPEDICESISRPLKSAGWKSYDGCRVMTYPFKRAPIDGDRSSYIFTRFAAAEPSTHFGVEVSANPFDAWGLLFMLSDFGEQEAIPLARQQGKTFFMVKLHYIEDHALFNEHCPETGQRCDCVERTLFAWKFSDGREFSRSE
ncbi:hypothetical protein ACFOLG_13630 [Vogesella facilis]|uniref:Uncharacterized protein n=1 Tax=Vogesella facilis TaxID=1655232 RepID=A0ABV7RGS3_9NEIS